MKESNNRIQRRPNMGNVRMSEKAAKRIEDAGVSPQMSAQVDRTGDRLLQLPQVSEITTLSPATLRWLRHRNEGPPFFRLHRRLVCWESELHAWIEAEAAKDRAEAS